MSEIIIAKFWSIPHNKVIFQHKYENENCSYYYYEEFQISETGINPKVLEKMGIKPKILGGKGK